MLVLAALCVALGVAPVLAVRALDAATGAWMGVWTTGLPAVDTVVPFGSIAVPVVAVAVAAGALCLALIGAARGTRTVGTWDCGYLEPAARMQYTGSSLGNGLVGLFQFVLHPRAEEPVIRDVIPAPSAYRAHVDDVVLERWVLPVVRWFADQCSRVRHRQSARIQTYITYVVVATLGLLLFARRSSVSCSGS